MTSMAAIWDPFAVSGSAPVIADGLTKRFGRREVVSDVTLTVPEGSIFALVGPNGAGKTTTIRMMLNLIRPTTGHAALLGKNSRSLDALSFQRIGFVSESQTLPEWMTIAAYLRYLRPLYPTWDEGVMASLSDTFALRMDDRVRQLSRGQRARLRMLTALAFRPKLLFVDELFSGLDPVARTDLVDGMLELATQGGSTVFLSSHEMEEVERLADHVAFLADGRLMILESLQSLLDRHRRIEATNVLVDVAMRDAPHGCIGTRHDGGRVQCTHVRFDPSSSPGALREWLGVDPTVHRMSLREIFIATARQAAPSADRASS